MTNSVEPPVKAPIPPVLIILLGLLFLVIAIIVGAVVFYKNCDECQEIFGGIAQGTTAMIEGMNAPGTSEMRALGCDQALAVNMEVFETMFAPITGDEQMFDDDMRSMKMLLCKQESFGVPEGPACSDVVRVWARAVNKQEGSALVVVQGRTNSSDLCQGIYAVDGTLIADLEGEL